jgi:hypothetical protein
MLRKGRPDGLGILIILCHWLHYTPVGRKNRSALHTVSTLPHPVSLSMGTQSVIRKRVALGEQAAPRVGASRVRVPIWGRKWEGMVLLREKTADT